MELTMHTKYRHNLAFEHIIAIQCSSVILMTFHCNFFFFLIHKLLFVLCLYVKIKIKI